MTITPYKFKARYYETDKMGIVHHSNYIRWFEEARVHCITEAGMSFAEIEDRGILNPVLSCSAEYKLAFRFDDTVIVNSKITSFNGVKLEIAYIVTDESGTVHATGTSAHCFTDMNMRPIRLQKKAPDVYRLYLDMKEALDNIVKSEE